MSGFTKPRETPPPPPNLFSSPPFPPHHSDHAASHNAAEMYDAALAPEASPFAATAHAAAEAVDAYSWSDDEEALDAYTQAFEDFYTARKAAIEQAYPLTEYYKQVPPSPFPSHHLPRPWCPALASRRHAALRPHQPATARSSALGGEEEDI